MPNRTKFKKRAWTNDTQMDEKLKIKAIKLKSAPSNYYKYKFPAISDKLKYDFPSKGAWLTDAPLGVKSPKF